MPHAGPVPPQLTFVMELRVTVGPPVDIGDGPRGRRRIVPIESGAFDGPLVRGSVIPGGADWQIVREDGVTELEARYTMQTDAGELIYVRNVGLRHAPPGILQKLSAGEDVDPRSSISGRRRRSRRPRHACSG